MMLFNTYTKNLDKKKINYIEEDTYTHGINIQNWRCFVALSPTNRELPQSFIELSLVPF